MILRHNVWNNKKSKNVFGLVKAVILVYTMGVYDSR